MVGTQIIDCLVLGLQGPRGGYGYIVVGQQAGHGRGISLEHGGAPNILELKNLVTIFVLVDLILSCMQQAAAECQHQRHRDQTSGERPGVDQSGTGHEELVYGTRHRRIG